MAEEKNKTRKYGKYYFVDPKTKLGYAKVQVPTDERDEKGRIKYKTVKKRAKNLTHADQLAKEILDDYLIRKTGFIEGEKLTFNEAANWYKTNKAIQPVYSEDGTKRAGMRTYLQVRKRIDKMKMFFGKYLIKDIDEDVLYRYKRLREKDKVLTATINRDFEDLRAMFRTFVRRRWLKQSPFDFGEKVIEKGIERRREVTLKPEQEFALLQSAKRSEKSDLYYVMLCLLDTGARPSEIYDASTIKAEPVLWKDFFDHNFRAVKLTSYKGRKKQIRFAPVTKRLKFAMMEKWNSLDPEIKDGSDQVFPVKSFKKAWNTARREADIAINISIILEVPIAAVFDGSIGPARIETARKEFLKKTAAQKESMEYIEPEILSIRLRDFRRHWSSFVAKLGVEGDLRQRMMGHEQRQTTFDYTQADLAAVLMVKDLMDDSFANDVEIQELSNSD